MTMAAACSCSYNYVQKNTFAKGFHRYLGVKLDETGCYEQTDLTQAIQSQPEYAMLVIAYLIGEHKTNGKYFNENTWDGKISAYPPYYKVNDSLDALYFFLEKIGYVMSTEENDIQNGSHELFFTEERAAGWVAAETTAGTSEATATAASA